MIRAATDVGKAITVLSLIVLAATGAMTAQGKTEPADSQAQAIEWNQNGSESIQANRFEEAKAFYLRAIDLSPRFIDAHENLALLFLLEGNDREAEKWARQLLAIDPGNYNGRLVAGVAAVNQHKFIRAKVDLAPLVKANAADPLPLAAYQTALKRTGADASASRMLARLTNIKVDERDALLAAQLFREPELVDWAQKWLEAAIAHSTSETNPKSLYMLAGIYAGRGKNAEAAGLYRRLLDHTPTNVDALVELSEIERILGDEQAALQHLYDGKKLASTNTPALLHFSQVCMRRRMFVDARDALQKIVEQEPDNREAWYQLGLAHYRLGEDDAAVQDFGSALKIDSSDEWSRIGLGAALLTTGNQADGEVEFLRVLKRDPKCAPAYYYLAQIHRGSGRYTLAAKELEHAAMYAPQDARPLAMLGQLQMERHDFVSARMSLKRAINLDDTSASAHYSMAMLLRSTGETQQAKREIELYQRYHDEDGKRGIVGLVRKGEWDYAGFMPTN
jgi:tetratricopeptide (TPR) repeat protein